jgi:hydroxyproline-rich glycoprotein DZ-HRGP
MHPAVACLAGAGSLLVIVSVFVPVTFINHDDGDGYKYIPFKTDPYFLLMISIFCYFSLVYLTRAIRKGEEDATLLAEFAFLASGIVMIGRLADLWQGVIRLRSNDGGRLDAGFSVGFWLIGVGGLLFLAAGIAGVLLAARRARFFAVIAWPSPLSARRRIALGALSGLGSALTIASAFPLFTTSPQYSGLESASILTRYVGILLTSLALAVLSCVFLALAAGRATWLRRRMLAAFAVLPLSFGAFAEVTGLEQWIIVRYWRSADSALSGSRTGPGFWLFVGAGLAFLLAGAFAARFIRDIDGRRFPPEIPVPQAHTPPPYGQPAQPLGGDPWNHPQPAGNPRPFPAYSQRFPGPPQSQGDPAPRQAPSHPTRDGQPAPVPSPPPRPRAEPTGPAPRDDASGPDAPGDTSRFAPPPKDPDGQP